MFWFPSIITWHSVIWDCKIRTTMKNRFSAKNSLHCATVVTYNSAYVSWHVVIYLALDGNQPNRACLATRPVCDLYCTCLPASQLSLPFRWPLENKVADLSRVLPPASFPDISQPWQIYAVRRQEFSPLTWSFWFVVLSHLALIYSGKIIRISLLQRVEWKCKQCFPAGGCFITLTGAFEFAWVADRLGYLCVSRTWKPRLRLELGLTLWKGLKLCSVGLDLGEYRKCCEVLNWKVTAGLSPLAVRWRPKEKVGNEVRNEVLAVWFTVVVRRHLVMKRHIYYEIMHINNLTNSVILGAKTRKVLWLCLKCIFLSFMNVNRM